MVDVDIHILAVEGIRPVLSGQVVGPDLVVHLGETKNHLPLLVRITIEFQVRSGFGKEVDSDVFQRLFVISIDQPFQGDYFFLLASNRAVET